MPRIWGRYGWESFIIRLDILTPRCAAVGNPLRIFRYSPWYTYRASRWVHHHVENLSLFALIYLPVLIDYGAEGWESFIIRLDILSSGSSAVTVKLRIFHYSPWYTYNFLLQDGRGVENLSLFALIYLNLRSRRPYRRWESFIIRLDILNRHSRWRAAGLRIFHYSPWYTYPNPRKSAESVENLSLFALIYLYWLTLPDLSSWESLIIRLDILIHTPLALDTMLRIFHYSPWYTYRLLHHAIIKVENLSLFALIYLACRWARSWDRWESFIIRLDILSCPEPCNKEALRIFHYSPWYT